jgi:hypothetical protein
MPKTTTHLPLIWRGDCTLIAAAGVSGWYEPMEAREMRPADRSLRDMRLGVAGEPLPLFRGCGSDTA